MTSVASNSSSVCRVGKTWGDETAALKQVLVNTPVREAHHVLCHVQHSWDLVTKSDVVDTKQCLVLAGSGRRDVSTSPVLVWVGFSHEGGLLDAAAQMSGRSRCEQGLGIKQCPARLRR